MCSLPFPVIYAGYFFGQYPCGWLIGRYPAQRVVALCILIWGVLVLFLTQARSFSTACESSLAYVIMFTTVELLT